ncbi:MAG TPA: ABC transporter permease [Verrucomicrobiae bacterium]|nr:ABC transporter permease [Verrucomicrobiae bacterium]
MTLMLGALTIGLILSLLAMGIFISFRVFEIADITVDGSITLGAALCAVLLVRGVNPALAMAASFLAGTVAGTITGVLQARFKINPLLSGILVMTALYSVNLHIMGRSNIPLLTAENVTTWADRWSQALLGVADVNVFGWMVAGRDLGILALVLGIVTMVGVALYGFLRTEVGTAMRAAGDNPQMIRALGVDVESYRILGLALSNGLVAWSGALLAQYQGFADAQMGIGMVVWGLASVIIGESLTGSRSLGLAIYGAIAGSVLFRLLVAMALRWGLNPNDLKIVTALFVFGALVLPTWVGTWRRNRTIAETAKP